jgi:hypothetical protein
MLRGSVGHLVAFSRLTSELQLRPSGAEPDYRHGDQRCSREYCDRDDDTPELFWDMRLSNGALLQRGGGPFPTRVRCDLSSIHAAARATNTRTRTPSSSRATRTRGLISLRLRQLGHVRNQI